MTFKKDLLEDIENLACDLAPKILALEYRSAYRMLHSIKQKAKVPSTDPLARLVRSYEKTVLPYYFTKTEVLKIMKEVKMGIEPEITNHGAD